LTAGFEREGEIVSAGVERPAILSIENEDLPLRAEKKIRNVFGKDVETTRDRSTAASVDMPDMFKMVGTGDWARDQDTSNRVFDEDELFSLSAESKRKMSLVSELYDEPTLPKPKMTTQLGLSLKDMRSKIGIGSSGIIKEMTDIPPDSEGADE
jgi:hypothetical protein